MEKNEGEVRVSSGTRMEKKDEAAILLLHSGILYKLVSLAAVVVIWQLAADSYNSELLLPTPWRTAEAFVSAVRDVDTLWNLLLTLQRVLTGFGIALFIGMSLGFITGSSMVAMQLVDPVVGTLRQVPVMAWVPLTIVWFGLGDGPTVFLIAIVGVFPVLLNTVAGVQSISKNYFYAARTMGAGSWSLFKDVMVPAALPDILTGMRLAVSAGWMSVI